METRTLIRAAGSLAAAALTVVGAGALVTAAGAQGEKPAKPAPKTAADEQQYKLTFGDTIITSEVIDYDMEKRQYTFMNKVDLVSKNSHMTANKMTVQMNENNELQWSKCEGNVWVEKKNPEDNTSMTATSRYFEYFDADQKANLQGNVIVHQ